MTTRLSLLFLLLWLPLNAAGQPAVQGEARFRAAGEGRAWVGQEQELQLELWSNGIRFADQHFLLPRVPGGFLLQADASTLKLSENRAGESWQGLRYTFLLYPQKAGRLEVPPFDVRFAASAGFGSEPTEFRFRTDPLSIEAQLPPGAAPGLLVTTPEFALRSSWEPALPEQGPLELRTGDALKLTVEREALGVPAMVFQPLKEPKIPGLAVYPDRPEVGDSINRGVLRGSRRDAITFIIEREGEFEIPAWTFQWWDPEAEELRVETIPAVAMVVTASPAYAVAEQSTGPGGDRVPAGLWRALLAGGVLLLVLFAYRKRWAAALQRRREARQAGEAWAFKRALRACAAGDPAAAYAAISTWLDRNGLAGPGRTLIRVADGLADEGLRQEAVVLQTALAGGVQGAAWDGAALAAMLRGVRGRLRREAARRAALVPLNPG